ncbi:SDR family oxidoreductase [Sphingopyxis sp. FD7]|uniref:SDR family oxidoreductase n=1 Tax=Sphingopyxis sp. FD7 TaxID=1914525 RepID=UPI000DC618FD|nr:SDR family oxidoreductase [Sphingopyxis sp. FD7]BBB14538.1 short-chain dehydrogenase [Sphingopyxis sp. FD7]
MTRVGSTAIVTGAGSGIGRAAALALGRKGYRLVLAGRRLAALEETAAAIEAPAQASPWVTDVTDAASVAALFAHTKDRFGRIDLVFNNAGIAASPVAIEDVPEDEWADVLGVNLTGAFLVVQAAFRAMRDQSPRGGRIINNGSIAATTPRPNSVAYACSKHGILGLTKAASLEGRKYDIACGQIDIGNAASAIGSGASAGMLQASGEVQAEPLMALEHVGDAVVYMDSLPLDANIQFLTIMATKMPFIGRG